MNNNSVNNNINNKNKSFYSYKDISEEKIFNVNNSSKEEINYSDITKKLIITIFRAKRFKN